MKPSLIFCQTILFIILLTDFKVNEVEAGHKVVSLGNWFGSLEKVNLQNVEGTENTAIIEKSEPTIRKKKSKKRKKAMRKDIEWIPEDDSSEPNKLIKKKRKKKVGKRNFIKTSVKEYNNTSDSDENDKRRKPVDIIVHIKMND